MLTSFDLFLFIYILEKLKASIAILGLHGIPTLSAVRGKYLELAKVYHPDIHGGDADKMKRFNEAYECIQSNAHILEHHLKNNITGKSTMGTTGQPKTPQQSNFDWVLDLRVSEDDMKDPNSHPNSPNNLFSYLDDLTLYKSVMLGNTSKQVARSFGYSEREIILRVQSSQFKRRIRHARKVERGTKTSSWTRKPRGFSSHL